MDFIYEVTSSKSFEDVVTAVQDQTQANGFRVLYTHDVQATLSEKNFIREPLKIIEICNAKYASNALKIEVSVSLLMPCRINVYPKEGKMVISTVRPKALVTMFQKPELEDFANEVENILIKIIDDSK